MTARAPWRLPVKVSCSSEEQAWGRLESLTPSRARLSCLAELRRYETLTLSFEVSGERFEGVEARVDYCSRDEDGFFAADADFLDPLTRRKLGQVLADVLSR